MKKYNKLSGKAKETLRKYKNEWQKMIINYEIYESTWLDEEISRVEEIMKEGKYDTYICKYTDESFEWSELTIWIAEKLFPKQEIYEEILDEIDEEIGNEKVEFFKEIAEKLNEFLTRKLKTIAEQYNYKMVEHTTKCDGKPTWWFLPKKLDKIDC